MRDQPVDRRTQRTRTAILEAFGTLVLERPYASIHVKDILERSRVGRSTFYEHYRNKDDVLRQALSGLFGVLAGSVIRDSAAERLPFVLDHFRENRRLARGLLTGSSREVVVQLLTDLVEETLRHQAEGPQTFATPSRLVAAQIAGGQLAMIVEWLSGRRACSSSDAAAALVRSTRAIVRGCSDP